MPASQSIHAHGDCRQALDAALESERGVRVKCETHGQAISFRQRAYTLRKSERKQAASMYGIDDPKHGTSVYDTLFLEVDGSNVLIKKYDQKVEVEEL